MPACVIESSRHRGLLSSFSGIKKGLKLLSSQEEDLNKIDPFNYGLFEVGAAHLEQLTFMRTPRFSKI